MAKKQTKKTAALAITAKTGPYRRAGLAFGTEPREIPIDDLTKEQIEMLKADSELVIEPTEVADRNADSAAEAEGEAQAS